MVLLDAEENPNCDARLTPPPTKFHLDKRAAQLAATTIIQPVQPSDDELLPKQTALWLGVSEQWLGLRRAKGDGPPFERLSDRVVRYRRDAILRWLDQRIRQSTAEYRGK